MDVPRPPAGLRAPGKALWQAVLSEFELTAGEHAILVEACRTRDELATLQAQLKKLPELVVRGSTGQPRAHPLLAELRNHRVLLERLCGALNLPDADELVGLRAASRHAQKAARGRWREAS